jgi:hypothetical protein
LKRERKAEIFRALEVTRQAAELVSNSTVFDDQVESNVRTSVENVTQEDEKEMEEMGMAGGTVRVSTTKVEVEEEDEEVPTSPSGTVLVKDCPDWYLHMP